MILLSQQICKLINTIWFDNVIGYKMVKWLKSIEFVEDYMHIGMGQGGHREDHMYYSPRAGI